MSNVLTVNPGSTAVKYVVFNSGGKEISKQVFDRKKSKDLEPTEYSWLANLKNITKISIRIVHAGDLHGPIKWSKDVEQIVNDFKRFAPIHNNLALNIIKTLKEVQPDADIIASFDTDFHKDMPLKASTYPIKSDIANKYNLKRYGFHGLVLESVINQLSGDIKKLPNKIICAHIGGGTSITAILGGKSIDTTMGLTPLEGLMMITRSGSVDSSMVQHLCELEGESPREIVKMLNEESGFYGLTGSKNTLDIINRASKRQEPERLAFDIFTDQLIKQIFAYYGLLQGCDALVFSGGIGYGNAYLRNTLLNKLQIINLTEVNTFVYQADEATMLYKKANIT